MVAGNMVGRGLSKVSSSSRKCHKHKTLHITHNHTNTPVCIHTEKYVNQGSRKYKLTKYAMNLNTDINTRRSTSHITTPIHYVAFIYRKVHKSGIQKLTAYNILEHGHKYIHQKTQSYQWIHRQIRQARARFRYSCTICYRHQQH